MGGGLGNGNGNGGLLNKEGGREKDRGRDRDRAEGYIPLAEPRILSPSTGRCSSGLVR